MAGQGTFATELSYDSLGRVKRTTYPGTQGFFTENQYNERGFLSAVTGLRSQAEAHDYDQLQPLIQEAIDLADEFETRSSELKVLAQYYRDQRQYIASLLLQNPSYYDYVEIDAATHSQLQQHQVLLQEIVTDSTSQGIETTTHQFIPIMMGDILVPLVHQTKTVSLPPETLNHLGNILIELYNVEQLIAAELINTENYIEQLIVLAEQTLVAADHNYDVAHTLDHSASIYGDLITEESTSTITYWRAADVDASGRISAEVYGNGIVNDYAYNQATGQLQSIHSSLLAVEAIRHVEYQYDAYQNLTTRDDLVNDIRDTYDYDRLDRLTNNQVSSSLYNHTDFNSSQSLSYDALGNITNKSDVGSYSYGSRPHAVTQAGNKNYAYDANGNMTSGDGRTIEWSSFNKPTEVTRDGKSATFSYGPSRARFKKVNHNGDTTIYVGSLYECVTKSGGQVDQKYYIYAAGQLVAEHILSTSQGTQTRYLHKGALGSVDLVTDAYANVIDRRSFDAWGKLRNLPWQSQVGLDDPLYLTQLPFTNKGYTGHEHVQEVALIHMNGRMYDATLARFISADPHIQAGTMSQSYNRYSYVLNNPMKYTDPSGYFFKKLKKALRSSHYYKVHYQGYKKVGNETGRFLIRLNKQQVRTVPYRGDINNYIATHEWAQVLGGIVAGYYGGAEGAAAWASFVTYTQGGGPEDMRKAATVAAATSLVSSYAQVLANSNPYLIQLGQYNGVKVNANVSTYIAKAGSGAFGAAISDGDPFKGALYSVGPVIVSDIVKLAIAIPSAKKFINEASVDEIFANAQVSGQVNAELHFRNGFGVDIDASSLNIETSTAGVDLSISHLEIDTAYEGGALPNAPNELTINGSYNIFDDLNIKYAGSHGSLNIKAVGAFNYRYFGVVARFNYYNGKSFKASGVATGLMIRY